MGIIMRYGVVASFVLALFFIAAAPANGKVGDVAVIKTVVDTGEPRPLRLNLQKAKQVEIISLKKENCTGQSNERYRSRCKKWNPAKTQIDSIIRSFKSVSSEEWYYTHETLCCSLYGKIKIDNKVYAYSINADAWMVIFSKGFGDAYFVYPGKDWKRYFLLAEVEPSP